MMKKNLIVLFLFVSLVSAFAQDYKIITKDGDVLSAYSVEISGTAIFYTTSQTSDANFVKIDKNKTYLVKKNDGTKVYQDNGNNEANFDVVNNASKEENLKEVSEEAKNNNRKQISLINNSEVEYVNEKRRGKDAGRAFCQLSVSENSVIVNDDIEMVCQFSNSLTSPMNYTNQEFVATILNKSDKTIYIDLGNTFFVRNGQSSVYYVPTTTTSTTSTSTGGGVNLGAVTGALGVGGALGTLSKGVTVGGGKTNGTSSTTYSQRIKAIPPKSSLALDPMLLFEKEGKILSGLQNEQFYKDGSIPCFYFGDDELKCGEILIYSENTSPIKFNSFVSYSFTEDCSQIYNLSANFYLSKIIGFYKSGGMGKAFANVVDNISLSNSTLGFVGFAGKTSLASGMGGAGSLLVGALNGTDVGYFPRR